MIAQLERRTRSRRVAGSNLREMQCCHVATGSLIHKQNEYPTVLYAPLGVEMCAGWKQVRVTDNNTVQRLKTGLPGSGAI